MNLKTHEELLDEITDGMGKLANLVNQHNELTKQICLAGWTQVLSEEVDSVHAKAEALIGDLNQLLSQIEAPTTKVH